jgi:hypothetical protein
MPIRSSLIFALSAFWISTIFGQTNSLRKLETAISDHVEDGRILGAQLIVGQHDKLLHHPILYRLMLQALCLGDNPFIGSKRTPRFGYADKLVASGIRISQNQERRIG